MVSLSVSLSLSLSPHKTPTIAAQQRRRFINFISHCFFFFKYFRNPKLINVCFNFCLFELILAPINLRKTANAIYNVCFVNDFGVFRVLEVSGRVNKSRNFDLFEKFELGFGRCLILGEN